MWVTLKLFIQSPSQPETPQTQPQLRSPSPALFPKANREVHLQTMLVLWHYEGANKLSKQYVIKTEPHSSDHDTNNIIIVRILLKLIHHSMTHRSVLHSNYTKTVNYILKIASYSQIRGFQGLSGAAWKVRRETSVTVSSLSEGVRLQWPQIFSMDTCRLIKLASRPWYLPYPQFRFYKCQTWFLSGLMISRDTCFSLLGRHNFRITGLCRK